MEYRTAAGLWLYSQAAASAHDRKINSRPIGIGWAGVYDKRTKQTKYRKKRAPTKEKIRKKEKEIKIAIEKNKELVEILRDFRPQI